MKNIIEIVLGFFLTFTFLHAELIEQNGQKDGYNVTLKSSKALVVGSNEFVIELAKDSKVVDNAKVKIKFFMPEMPGMPYMESESEAVLVNEKYNQNSVRILPYIYIFTCRTFRAKGAKRWVGCNIKIIKSFSCWK